MKQESDGDGSGRVGGPKCIALVGPFAGGKTTLFEAILARSGALPRQGSVADKNTLGDASPEARAHQMSVEANIAETDFMGDKFTFIDCPGSIEFAFEAEAILSGADLAVVVAEGDAKKIPALQVILKSLEDRRIPHVLFLNKIDKSDRGVRDTLTMLQIASGVPLVLRHLPMRQDGAITGFIDLALERAFVYREHAPSEIVDMNDQDKAGEVEARYSMLETLADYDDALMEQLLEDIPPSRERVFADLVTDFRQAMICPVLIGSAASGHGVGRLLKFIRHEAPGMAATRRRLRLRPAGEAGIAQVLKTIHTIHAGKLSVVRVLAGTIADAAELVGPSGPAGRVSSVVRINGQQTAKREAAKEGETVGLGKLNSAPTGATLSTAKAVPVQLVALTPPEPVLALAIASAERKDEVKLSSALAKAIEEDPSLRLVHAQETGQTLIEGQGEMHLRVTVERLTGKYGIALATSEPAVPYKETIRAGVSIRGRHKKQSGGHGQFGDVVLEIKPLKRGSGFQFSQTITGGVVPRNYIPSVELGVAEYLKRGPLGFPLVDIGVTLTDGSYHAVDSSDMAFRMAAQIAMREGMVECKPVLLEPVLHVEIAVPSDCTARVIGIVPQRRGQILGFDARPHWPGWDLVEATIPEAEIRDLIVELRSITAGVGTFKKRFDHLAELTGRLADQAIERAAAVRAA